MADTFKLQSRYRGSPEAARAWKLATVDLWEESERSPILGFEVCDVDGHPIGRVEAYVTLLGETTPERFVAAVREDDDG